MSRTIDERVVSMQFDNRNFESNVRTTMSTLDKLKARLNLSGASKGLEGINTAAKNCNLSPIGNAVDSINVKFSKLQVAAASVLGDIATRAYRAGESLVKSFTIEPITTGFNEYELKMNSIQTIMASTGESLETVNEYLNELNKYSDETIYSFADMTQNIGKFTNAGIGLEDAVTAIKGIANEAALSGANANEAARAMYNFSQALSTGYVQRIDWKSIELANMATVEFKEQLLEQAVAMGTVTKNAAGMYAALGDDTYYNTSQMFIEALDEQWLTSQVLIETLKDYADAETEIGARATQAATEVKTFSHMMDTLKESAQSGWAQTWEIVLGDFNEGKNLWTSLNDVLGGWISKSADARNSMLTGVFQSEWVDIDTFTETLEEAGISLDTFEDKLVDVANASDVDLKSLIEQYGSLGKVLVSGEVSIDMVRKALGKLLGIESEAVEATEAVTGSIEEFQDIVQRVVRGEFGNGAERIQKLTEAGWEYADVQALVNQCWKDGVLDLSKITEEQLINMGYTAEQTEALAELAKQAEDTGVSLDELMASLQKKSGRELIIESFTKIFEKLQPVIEGLKKTWDDTFADFPTVGDVLSTLIRNFAEFADGLVINEDKIKSITKTFEGLLKVMKTAALMSGGAFGYLFKLFNMVANELDVDFWNLTETVAEVIIQFYDWITTNNTLYKSLISLGDAVISFITSTIDKVRTWIDYFLELPYVASLISNLASSFNKALSSVGDWLEGFISIFAEFLNHLINMDSFTFEGIVSALGKLFSGIFGQVSKIIGGLSTPFTKLIDLVIAFFAELGNGSNTAEEFYKNFDKIKAAVNKVAEPIGTFIDKLLGWGTAVSEWISTLKDAEDLPKAIADGITGAVGILIGEVANLVSSLGQSIRDGMTGVSTNAIAGLVMGLLNGVRFVAEVLYHIGENMITAIMDVLDEHSPSRVMMAIGVFAILGLALGLQQAAPEVWNAIVGFGSELLSRIKTTFAPVFDFISEIDFGKLLSVAITAGMLAFVVRIVKIGMRISDAVADVIESVAGIAGGVKKVLGSISDLFGEMAKNEKAKRFQIYAEAIKSLAIAIGILAASIAILTLVDQDKMWSAVGAISAMMGVFAVFAGLVALIEKIGKISSLNFGAIAIGIAGMAFGISIIASAAKKLSDVPTNQLDNVIVGLLGIMVGLTLVTTMFGHFADADVTKNINKLGGVFIKLGAAMLIMAYVAKITGSLDETQIQQGYTAVATFGTVISALIWVSKYAGSEIKTIGNTMVKIGIVFLLMTQVVKSLGDLPAEQLEQGMLAIAAFAGVIVAINFLMRLISLIPSKSGSGINDIGSTLLKVATAMLLISASAMLLGSMQTDELYKAGSALAVIMIFIGLLIAALKPVDVGNLKGIGSTILTISAAMLALSLAAKIFGSMEWKQLLSAGIAIAVLGAGIAGLVKILGNIDAKNLKGVGTTLMLAAGAIAILATVATVVGLIDTAVLAKGVVAVAVLGVLIAGILKVTEKSTDAKSTLIGIAIAMAVLAAAIVALSFIDSTSLLSSVSGLSIVMIVLAAMIDKIGSTKVNIGSIAMITGAVIVLGGLLYILGQLNPGNALAAAGALSAAMLAMSATMVIINKFGSASGSAKSSNTIKLLGVLAIVSVVIAGAIRIIGELESGEALSAAATLSITLLALAGTMAIINKVGTSSGTIKFGNITKTLLAMTLMTAVIGTALWALGSLDQGKAYESAIALSATMLALAGAMAIISTVCSGGSVGSLLAMSVALIAIGASMIMIAQIPSDQLWSVFGVLAASMVVLTVAIVALSAAFTAFAPGAALVVGALLSIAVVAISVGAAAIMFSSALQIAGTALPLVANGLTLLITSLAGCSDSAWAFIGVSAALLVGMSSIGVGLAVLSAGVLVMVAAFAASIIAISAAITVGIVAISAGIAAGALAISVSLTASIVLLAAGLTVGILAVAAGLTVGLVAIAAAFTIGILAISIALTAGLSLLSVGLVVVSAAIYLFASALTVGATAVYIMASAIAFLGLCISDGLAVGIASGVELVKTAVTGLVDAVVGTVCSLLGINSPSWVMQQIGQYTGEGFALGLSESEGDVNTAATGLADAAKSGLGEAGSEGGSAFNTEALSNMDLSSLLSGSNIDTSSLTNLFSSTGSESGSAFNTSAVESMNFSSILSGTNLDTSSITELFSGIGTESGAALTSGASESASMQPTLDSMLGEISNSVPQFTEAGSNVLLAFSDGLSAASSSVSENLNSDVQSMASTAKNGWSSFYSAGKHLASGFASGISANSFRAEAAAKAMANAAYSAAKNALDINSPSKVFRELGTSVPEGFAMGIGMLGGMISDSIDVMAGGAIDETRNVIARIADVIDADIDSQPTIRPVLDLSDITSGINSMNGMLGVNPSVGVMTNVGSISSMMNRRSQNGSNSEVVSAIKELNKNLDKVGNTSYNINGVTYDDGSNISEAVRTIVRAARVERRV